ncbi:MAG: flagellar type III secretion system pore protein FliP [Clostridia bacterium]|nr:flagellar type III secretion system pore protein FliP [Clostridia bacterium]
MTDALININGNNVETLNIIIILTILSLVPSILMLTTSFTRIIIVLSILKNALGLQNTPPNMVLVGIALFLTLFIMNPVLKEIDEVAYQPYSQGQITQVEAIEKAEVPMKEFMLKQTKQSTLKMYADFAELDLSKIEKDSYTTELPMTVVIPAYITSEISRAFLMGFLLYLPFMIIDVVVACTLMSMGMMMLPPSMISMPFKLLLFVVVDGWGLTFSSLVQSFN